MRRVVLLLAIVLVAAACGGSSSGPDPDRFCELDAEITANDPFEASSPDEVRAIIGDTEGWLDEIEAVAPDEIKADTVTLNGAIRQILDLIEDADFDMASVDFAAVGSIFSAEVQDAEQAVTAWSAANCS
jgi:ABC-type glycerol-3-phosphate transport system substrate-binding protein